MTNREKLEKLSSYQISYFIYEYIYKYIGSRYTSSIDGVSQWLDEEEDKSVWNDFDNRKGFVKR